MAKGFTLKYGIGYTETLVPVVKYSTIRILLAMADVITGFLNGNLHEPVFMEQLECFKQAGQV